MSNKIIKLEETDEMFSKIVSEHYRLLVDQGENEKYKYLFDKFSLNNICANVASAFMRDLCLILYFERDHAIEQIEEYLKGIFDSIKENVKLEIASRN